MKVFKENNNNDKRYTNANNMSIEHSLHSVVFEGYKFLYKNYHKKDDAIGVNIRPELSDIQENNRNGITWIGHSTFLIQLNQLNILTDPVWSKRVGGIERSNPVPFGIKRLPRIHVILLSHSHYDHLDLPTLKKLEVWEPLYLVPEGLKDFLRRRGIDASRIVERQWWESLKFPQFSFKSVPAQHTTRRGLFDKDTSHWCGWVIETSETTLYFAGDTGYFDGFKQIGKDTPDIDYALMPIGAYGPESFNKLEHTNPEEAVQGFLDMRADHFIPMHYGTFRLGDDSGLEAKRKLMKAWEEADLSDEQLSVLKIGDTKWF